jgi:hypothetical protein
MSTGDPADRDGDTDAPKNEHEERPDRVERADPDRLDVDAQFAAIVANWGEEPPTAWPAPVPEEEQDVPPSPGRLRGSEWGTDWEFAGEDPLPGGRGIRDLGPLDEFDPDELPAELRGAGPRDHSPTPEPEGYEPPEPPPLPRGDLVGRLAWAAVIGGPLFMLISVLAWRPPQLLILIALACFAGGFVTLVSRMPKHRDDDDDDGAVV